MRTRSQSRNLHHQQQQAPPPVVELFNLEEPIENPASPVVTMNDNRTMAQLLEAPTEGYEDAIVVTEITADNFELKHGCSTLQTYQAPAYQAPAPQIQCVSRKIYKPTFKANDACDEELQIHRKVKTCIKLTPISMRHAFQIGITTRSGVAYKGPTIPITSSPKVMERETEVTKDTMPPANNRSTEEVQPPVVPIVHHESISEPGNAPVSASMPNQKASIPFPSRRNDERRREKTNDEIEKFYEIFRDLSFEISFTDALMLMPKFASTLKTLI
ncbi:hypothetical protein Tco_0617987 [Tanacetum coccineum]